MPILIPKPIMQKYELFPGSGWGLVEAALVAGGMALGMGTLFGLIALGVPVPVGLIVGVLIMAVGAGLAIPVPGQTPLYQLIGAWRTYKQKPFRYQYDWTASDWEDFPDETAPSDTP